MIQRNLAAQQQMMQDRQHHDRVKLSATAAKKRSVLTVLPTDSRRRDRKVHTEREDVPCSFPVKAIHALAIAFDGHNLRSHLCCENPIGSGLTANTESTTGPPSTQAPTTTPPLSLTALSPL